MGIYGHKIPVPLGNRVCVTERVCAHTCKHMHMWVVVGWVQYSFSFLVFISHVLKQIFSESFVCLYQSI
jgi:hypothetical protein